MTSPKTGTVHTRDLGDDWTPEHHLNKENPMTPEQPQAAPDQPAFRVHVVYQDADNSRAQLVTVVPFESYKALNDNISDVFNVALGDGLCMIFDDGEDGAVLVPGRRIASLYVERKPVTPA